MSRNTDIWIRSARGGFDLDLHELWIHRELLYFLIWRDLKVRYKQTVFGIGWAILPPFLTMLAFSLCFGRLRPENDGIPHALFYYAGLVPWTYVANALSQATNVMVENQRMITKVYFPRLVLPISAVMSGLIDLALCLAVFIVLMTWYRIPPSAPLLLLPLFLGLAIGAAFGAGVWLAALNARYRDVRYAVPFAVQFGLFLSPIAYPVSIVPEQLRWLYGLNPMVAIVGGFRWSLAGTSPPDARLVVATAAFVLGLIVTGLRYFARVEGTLADVV